MLASYLLGMLLIAATNEHRVTIGPGLVYNPAVLVVRAGDSVRFAASDVHPLVGDGGDFDCLDECVVRFDRVGSHGFHCGTHGVPGSRMAGIVHVVNDGGFVMPAPELDGTWYDPAHPGQGVTIEVMPEARQVVVGWFTWSANDAGTHDWLTGLGALSPQGAQLALSRTSGGRFAASDAVTSAEVGHATLRFFDCSTASLEFSRTDNHRSGVLRLQRLAPARAECRDDR
jgi:hypothetical protein